MLFRLYSNCMHTRHKGDTEQDRYGPCLLEASNLTKKAHSKKVIGSVKKKIKELLGSWRQWWPQSYQSPMISSLNKRGNTNLHKNQVFGVTWRHRRPKLQSKCRLKEISHRIPMWQPLKQEKNCGKDRKRLRQWHWFNISLGKIQSTSVRML